MVHSLLCIAARVYHVEAALIDGFRQFLEGVRRTSAVSAAQTPETCCGTSNSTLPT
jgi:hypothetical protein